MPNFNQITTFLSQKVVGIAGAGGLGSNCAAALVRSGIGKLIIADFDTVSPANLNRQFYFHDQIGMNKVDALRENLLRISPMALLQIHNTKVSPENISLLFSVCDVVVEAFDDAFQKQMLIEYMLAVHPDIPLVAASGMAGYGNREQLVVIKSNNLYVCGDGSSEVSEDNPPMAPRVGIVSNMEADVVIEILLSKANLN
ncbi:MAG: thiamine biosynthesis protein ThiF [Bacteroidetes bacterium HGW-Bacteroidetes-8]|jgi:sulfur carrier protein ThiS adenylyltransferase|nr:MAG: thiamine biosynthesis protein ThiF [Bacteroidetes bacterium HGW-Bacteroidetes-8]